MALGNVPNITINVFTDAHMILYELSVIPGGEVEFADMLFAKYRYVFGFDYDQKWRNDGFCC